eukprot:scaffold49078_cov18-Tisochrysis_lutea.AAC.2
MHVHVLNFVVDHDACASRPAHSQPFNFVANRQCTWGAGQRVGTETTMCPTVSYTIVVPYMLLWCTRTHWNDGVSFSVSYMLVWCTRYDNVSISGHTLATVLCVTDCDRPPCSVTTTFCSEPYMAGMQNKGYSRHVRERYPKAPPKVLQGEGFQFMGSRHGRKHERTRDHGLTHMATRHQFSNCPPAHNKMNRSGAEQSNSGAGNEKIEMQQMRAEQSNSGAGFERA